MLRLEVLDQNERVVSVHKLDQGLTILGRSPGADVHLTGEGVGPMHVGIKVGKKPVIMDLGGPSALRLNGKEIVEHELDFDGKAASAMLEIGARKVRLARTATVLQDPRRVPWAPVSDGKSKALNIRVRLYVNGRAVDVVNTRTSFKVGMGCGVGQDIDVVWFKNKEAHARVPREWLVLGGRIQIGSGKDARIEKLDAWAVDTRLETGVVYRILAGPYALEILVSEGALIIGGARPNPFPAELRKPFAVSTAVVAAVFALWMLLFGRPDAKVEEPYPVYARIQNIPVEKIPEPEQTAAADLPQAGGGSGSDSKENTAPTVGAAASAPVSKLAAALTGGLKNLVGSVVSQSKNSGAVMSETGVGVAAAAGAPGPAVGRLAAVGGGATGAAGAAKLGNLAIAGAGKGYGGGSGMGLGSGAGTGIGNGVGAGIGRGGFRLVEEESIVDGGLDKSVIAAVIQNNLSQIKYCYERQLVADPDLFGKVVVSWVINAAGTVEATGVKQTTLNSSPVEQCMLTKIAGWKFPQPKNGTKVNVVYPFLFKSTK